ncbi:type II secretion system F family protein [Patescibacteria group bacterium]|nr:type II secretion system F family protein [Patescibacteria group bacterium]
MFEQISTIDKVFFANNISIMIKAGLPLREAAATLQEQTKSKVFKKILEDIIKRLDNGESLADSLVRHPRSFSPLFVNIIRVGEASGTLEENLKYLAIQLEKSYDLHRKVKGAMIYPLLVLTSTFVLGGALAVFILPKLLPLFKSFDVQLPLPTKILIWITETIQNHGFLIFGGLIIFIILFTFLSRLKPIKKFNHKILLRIPLFGRISRSNNLAQFCRTLGVLLKSGIPIVQGLEITSQTLKNMSYKEAIVEASNKVQRGKPISDHLKIKNFLFPITVSKMIQVGEKTGNLEQTMFYLAEFYEKEIDNVTKNLSNILEPILLIVIGLVVGFIAIAIILPIYKLTGGFQ